MNEDYIKTKVDFYKKYNDNYDIIFVNEVDPSCEIINSDNNAAGLQRKVRNVRDALQNIQQSLQTDWQDSVEGQFSNYINSCDTYLGQIETSIEGDFTSAETCYTELKNLLNDLSSQNTAYQTRWDEKPNLSDSKYTVTKSGYTDEAGVYHNPSSYQNEEAYSSDYQQWETDVNAKASECINTISEIETKITELTEINTNVLNIDTTDTGFVGSAPQFELNASLGSIELTGTVKEFIEKNNIPYQIVNMGGKDYYVLANISNTNTQGHDQCLSYANAYASGITAHNGYDISNNGNGGHPYLYSSTDPNEIYLIAASEYANRRSSVLEVNGKGDGRHFVAVTGFAADADFSNIQPNDILICDPTSDKDVGYKVLGTDLGGQRRNLTSARAMRNNSFDTDYAINVYGDIDYAELLENTRLASTGATQAGASSDAIKFASV